MRRKPGNDRKEVPAGDRHSGLAAILECEVFEDHMFGTDSGDHEILVGYGQRYLVGIGRPDVVVDARRIEVRVR